MDEQKVDEIGCRELEHSLFDYVEHDMDEPVFSACERHVENCCTCQELIASYERSTHRDEKSDAIASLFRPGAAERQNTRARRVVPLLVLDYVGGRKTYLRVCPPSANAPQHPK